MAEKGSLLPLLMLTTSQNRLLLQALLTLVQADAMGPQLLMRPFAVTGLISLISSHHLAATANWQQASEEGCDNAQSILSLAAAILHNPFLPGGASEAIVKELQEVCTYIKAGSKSQCIMSVIL